MNSKKNNHFDVAVLGGGPGGYPAAIKASQLGKKVALIEKKDLGGTCLNRGCIPSKTLIANANLWKKIEAASLYGITVNNPTFDYAKMAKRKDEVVEKVRNSLGQLIEANGITLFRGFGKLTGPKTIKIMGDELIEIEADKIIIATGSEPKSVASFPFDYEKIHDSTSLLNLTSLPKSILIIGGGIIGCEFASLFNAFDVEVSILEMMPHLIPTEAPNVSDTLEKAFKKKGIRLYLEALVQKVEKTKTGVRAYLAGDKTIDAEIALVAIGRSLNTSGIGLENAGVIVLPNGLIEVNERMETNVPGIYAVGDIASKYWLAHVATHQGIVAANNAAGQKSIMHYNAIPSVIFTEPEIASIGLNLEEALKEGYDAKIGSFPFQALGKSQAIIETEGFAQVVIDKKTGELLGAQVVGYDAGNLIAEMGIAMSSESTVETIMDTIHAHPTVAESWLEAALLANDTPLHLPKKKKKALRE